MSSLKTKKVLITCGPTCVAVDSMRVLSNRSTGELGQQLAVKLAQKGAGVTVLEGPVLKALHDKKINVLKYFFYDELEQLLNRELKKKYDVVIHAAAVSDYKLAKPFQGKISSKLKQLTLKLVPTKKLINTIKKQSPKTFLVGFKLIDKLDKKTVAILLNDYLKNTKSDMVVVNSLNKNTYQAFITDSQKNILDEAQSRQELTTKLVNILKDVIPA